MRHVYLVVIEEPADRVESDEQAAENVEQLLLDGMGYPENVTVKVCRVGVEYDPKKPV